MRILSAGDVRRSLAALLLLVCSALPGLAAELLMFTRADCAFCRKWEREIEPIYGKAPEGRVAVLRKIRTDRPLPPDIRFNPPIVLTPTFVLMDDGREIGRFAGYNDEATFWGLLTMLLRKLDDMDPPAPTKTRAEVR
jgi:hypothetical protein